MTTFEIRIQAVLVRAWRFWTTESDGGQERCARILSAHVKLARLTGISDNELFNVLTKHVHNVPIQQFNEMLAFLDDWEGAR